MNCPYCGAPDTRVVNSRPSPAGDSVRRRRECQKCGRRFTTSESIERVEVVVVKRDKTREPFDIAKLRRGIEKSCEKRAVSEEQIERVITYVERDLLTKAEREVPSERIGKLVLKRLKDLDPVAYLRYASVYKGFRDLQDFNAEIKTLLKD
ncbi:transcriptional regulator NrdR [bacterium]|nr:transcriptional regulator NrdR [bacterium]